jgi:hypothetical protein
MPGQTDMMHTSDPTRPHLLAVSQGEMVQEKPHLLANSRYRSGY